MTNVLIARQPIVNSKHEIYGYEILSRSNLEEDFSKEGNTPETDAKQLFNILSTFGIGEVLSGRTGFLNCILEKNSMEYFDLIVPKNIVLEIQKPKQNNLETIQDFMFKIEMLTKKGYLISLGSYCFLKEFSPLINYANIIKINTKTNEYGTVEECINRAKKLKKTVILEKIESIEEFNELQKYLPDYFQGFYFCKPIVLSSKITDPYVLNVIKIINLVMREAEIKEIENSFKTDPILIYKLLKYLSSYSINNGIKIESIRSAIQFLGYKKLLKWLSVLFASIQKNAISNLVGLSAIERAKFMENLALSYKEKNKFNPDNCFIVGIFSYLDALLGVDLKILINLIQLPQEVINALLGNSGELTKLLHLVKYIEEKNWVNAFAIAYELDICTEDITKAQIDAINWTNKINH